MLADRNLCETRKSIMLQTYMKKIFLCAMLCIPFFWCQAVVAEYGRDLSPQRLRTRIASERTKDRLICQGELICGIWDLPLFYKRRDFEPAWAGLDLKFSLADVLIDTIRAADQEGLHPGDYHLERLEALLKSIRMKQAQNMLTDSDVLLDFDILLTDAFLLLGSHFRAGRVNPETIHAKWSAYNPKIDMAAILQSALDSGRIRQTLKGLLPPHAGYDGLRRALAKLTAQQIQVGWVYIPPGPALHKWDQGLRVAMLRKRLEQSDDNKNYRFREADFFDDDLAEAVRNFQKRNGLKADGVVGNRTLAALNVPIDKRIRQVKLNLERWRWVPHDLGWRYVMVNIADFKLTVVSAKKPIMEMRVVVGRNYRRTPVFSAPMKYMVLNPYWNIPVKIAVRDILPKVQQNIKYLSARKIRVFANWQDNAPEVEPKNVDWFGLGAHNFRFKMRQDPNRLNALGRVKFMFPNKYAIYLHDTPVKSLFKKASRGFSSGCIRLEKPIDLAAYLLQGDDRWSHEKLLQAISAGERRAVHIPQAVMVHLLYWTAWQDQDGRIHYRDDIYKRDKPLTRALQERQPRPLKLFSTHPQTVVPSPGA